MTKIAYLEISPRLTGKTTRLVELARQQLEAGSHVRFVCRPRMKEEIQLRLPGATVLADGEQLPEGQEPDDGVWFYDEFDWLQSTQVREGGYYASTARYVRKLGEASPDDDVLLQLIEAKGGRFERFYWPFDMDSSIEEARQLYTPDEFRLWFLGECFQ